MKQEEIQIEIITARIILLLWSFLAIFGLLDSNDDYDILFRLVGLICLIVLSCEGKRL